MRNWKKDCPEPPLKKTVRLDAMESGQQTQDETIGDLGQAVSDMMEGGV